MSFKKEGLKQELRALIPRGPRELEVRPRITIIYNKPNPDLYETRVEKNAALAILTEVEGVGRALAEQEYPVTCVPLQPPLELVRDKLKSIDADLVFNLFEGFDGLPETEAIVADLLSYLGVTYTGCSEIALSLGLDKVKAKAYLQAAGIDTPRYQMLSPETVSSFYLNYPCIVKPYAEDGSSGISEESVVYDFASLKRLVTTVSKHFGGRALVEEFADGREFNVTVLGNKQPKVLPVSEIVYSLPHGMPKILTLAAKWEPQSLYFKCTKAICPAEISIELHKRITKIALLAFKLLGCHGYARFDFRLDPKGQLNLIELNPNPDISPNSGAALQAQTAGMIYNQFIEKIVLLALDKEMRTRPKLRPMTKEDKPAIMEMLQNMPEFKPTEVEVAKEVLDSYLQDPLHSGYHVLTAEINSSIAGYICYGPTPLTEGTWDIYWLAVSPKEQKRGIGRALLTLTEDNIKKARGRLIFIETSSKPEYQRARNFYRYQSYTPACRIADFYAAGDDKIVFQKRLR